MSITVSGILSDPMGNVMSNTAIRLTTESSYHVAKGLAGTVITGTDGSYTFPLKDGVYMVELKQAKEYTKCVYVEVTASTPAAITLATLMNEHEVTV